MFNFVGGHRVLVSEFSYRWYLFAYIFCFSTIMVQEGLKIVSEPGSMGHRLLQPDTPRRCGCKFCRFPARWLVVLSWMEAKSSLISPWPESVDSGSPRPANMLLFVLLPSERGTWKRVNRWAASPLIDLNPAESWLFYSAEANGYIQLIYGRMVILCKGLYSIPIPREVN